MSSLTTTHQTVLEAILGMRTGYVLDFTDGSFANLFSDLGIDIYDTEAFPGFSGSKANRMRALWKTGTDVQVSATLRALAEYVEAKHLVGELMENVTVEQITKVREIAKDLAGADAKVGGPVSITTEATVARNQIHIEIHDEIYAHIEQYLANKDYFHAVDESYKFVREKLRELTGEEAAHKVFNENAQNAKFYPALFGKATPADRAEGDFFRGIGYLHLGVQFLRNEKAHTLATSLEPNLAIHYIALASLAYDLITKYVSEETVAEIESLVQAKKNDYRSATAFYRDFKGGRWLESFETPPALASASVRKILKNKWLSEVDFTIGYDHSNVDLMRLELVIDQLTQADVDHLLDSPTKDRYGNDQLAGMYQFLQFVEQHDPELISPKAKAWLAEHE